MFWPDEAKCIVFVNYIHCYQRLTATFGHRVSLLTSVSCSAVVYLKSRDIMAKIIMLYNLYSQTFVRHWLFSLHCLCVVGTYRVEFGRRWGRGCVHSRPTSVAAGPNVTEFNGAHVADRPSRSRSSRSALAVGRGSSVPICQWWGVFGETVCPLWG